MDRGGMVLVIVLAALVAAAWGETASRKASEFAAPGVWEYSGPLISPEKREKDPSVAQKDPSVVFHDGKWHVFMTVKLPGRSAIEYCSFGKWEEAEKSKRVLLEVSESKYFCAPQVFYFRPQKKWYMVYQMGVAGNKKMAVAYSTTEDIGKPESWTKARAMLDGGAKDPRVEGGLDYWVICDEKKAYLFFTSLNGKLWRMWTKIEDFPSGLDHPEVALRGEFFEASHTYKLAGTGKYLTIIEVNGRRYYKGFVADSPEGEWKALGNDALFAAAKNIRPAKGVEAWTDNVSHGELVRAENDETMTVDPEKLEFVFQGMMEKDKGGKGYGQFGWRIGVMRRGK